MPLFSTCQWNGPELMAVISPDLPDGEWEGSDHVVNEVDGICLGVAFVDFEGAYTGCVVNGRDLEAPDPVIALQIPDDAHGAEVIIATKVRDLLGDRWRRLVVMVMRHRALIGQSGFTM